MREKKATVSKGDELKIYHLILFNLVFGLAYSILIYFIFHILVWSLFKWYVIFFEIVIIWKDSIFATYGIFGLISMDWIALLIVLFIDFIIGFTIVELTMKKIKDIPISVGVLT